MPPGFAALTAIYPSLYPSLGLGGGVCLRFGLGSLILIVPTTFIGGTLPLMGRLALRRPPVCRPRSALYAVNTLGSVLGAVLTGFLFLRSWACSSRYGWRRV